MPRLVISKLGSATVMGQQRYEAEVCRRARSALGPQWSVREETVRGLRSPVEGTRRIPAALLGDAAGPLRTAAGRLIHRGADLAHRMDLRLPPARREVVMIHDVVPWRFPDEGRPPAAALREVRRAAAVVTPSRFAAREVTEVFGVDAPVAIHNGVDPAFFDAEPLADEQLAGLGLREPFVLHAGGCTQRKNLAGLAAAWRLVRQTRPGCRLALAGPGDPRRDRLFGTLDGAVRLGRVPGAALRGLMAAAAAVVVPSVYEGFGLPALEALAAGTPVVAADRSSLPEVCGDAALLVEPDAAGLAEGILTALEGGAEIDARRDRGRARAREFSWDRNAREHADLWRTLVR